MSEYRVQPLLPFIGASKTTAGAVTLSPVTLTATPSDNRKEMDVDGMLQVVLYIRYITGAAETNNVLGMTIEFSPDGVNYYQELSEEVTTSTDTLYQVSRQFTGASAGTTYSLRMPIPVADIKKLRISFSETGVAANFGSLSVLAVNSGR